MRLPKINGYLLVLNLGLLLAVGYLLKGKQAIRASAPEKQETPAQGQASPSQAVVAANDPAAAAPESKPFHWSQLESEDYKAYIARLRRIGCPEQTIRDIIIADLDKLLAPRLQAIYGWRQDLQYWHPEEEELANNQDRRDWWRQEKEIERTKREIIQELVQTDLIRERLNQKGYKDYYERRLGFLPGDKRSQVRSVLERYDDEEQKVRSREWDEDEPLNTQEQAQVKQLQEERRSAVASLLSPAEQEQYELWMSKTANTVRRAVYGMEASEEEFLAIYRARKTFDQDWSEADPALMDEGTRGQWEQAKASLNEEVRQQLGEQRFQDYKRGEDEDFHHLNTAVTRYKLPRETAVEVYEYKRVLTGMRSKVEADASLSQDQRQALVKAMRDETLRSVKALLGDRPLNYYLKRGQGQWLRN